MSSVGNLQLKINHSLLSENVFKFTKQITEKDPNFEQDHLDDVLPTQVKFYCQMNKIKSQKSTSLETSSKFYLFLFRTVTQEFSSMIVVEYQKQDGANNSNEFNGIKGQITFAKAIFSQPKSYLQKKEKEQVSKSKRNAKNMNQIQIVLLLGTTGGYFKIIRICQMENNDDMNIKVDTMKLDNSPIVFIKVLQPEYFYHATLCLVLSQTNRVYLINFDTMKLIAYYFPTIPNCDVALSLSINNEQKYFISATSGGYVIFWEFSERIMNSIKNSKYPENETGSGFKDKQIVHNIIPISIFHSIDIGGLKWIQVYGVNLIMITKSGTLQLYSVNNDVINDNDYCCIFKYDIDDGHLITDVKFFPQNQQIFIVKSSNFDQKNRNNSKSLNLREQLNKFTKKLDSNFRSANPKHPDNGVLPDSKHKKGGHEKICYFQRLKFGPDLKLHKRQKIYGQFAYQHIEGLEINSSKQIVILRQDQNYLVGGTQIFKNTE